MGSLVPSLIVIGLAASVSPVAVMILITVLSRKNARRNSLLWLLGFTLTLIALGFAGVFLLQAGGSGRTGKLDGYIDITLGGLCLLGVAFALLRRKKDGGPKVVSDMNVMRAFTLGCISMVVNISTFIIFVSGLHVISESHLKIYEDVISLGILTFFTLTTVLIPIAIYFVFPSKSEKALASFRGWLMKHSKVIKTAILLIFGVYLLVKGVRTVF